MSSLYKHLEFSDAAKQIRLLRLEPSPTGTDEYAFSLEVHDFQENSRPSYIAISYAWGLPIPKLPVVINGFRMEVQFNCWYALWQMRHHGYTSDVNFWIDSLCINQGDDAEKGHQVAMMGDIFSSASLVAASLGIGESLADVREILASGDNSKIGKLRGRFDQLPYFERVWIKQEIVLAKDVTIFYGLEKLSWSEFADAVNTIKVRSRYLKSDSPERVRLERISNSTQLCNHRSQVTQTPTFMDLVARYRTAKASVAVNKIYALLSLLPQNDPIRQKLPIRYGQSTCFPLFRDLIKLLYRYYKDERVGDKHMALSLIRDSLEIHGLDAEVIAFFESQTWGPSNARLFHQESATVTIFMARVLNDRDSKDLRQNQPIVDTNQAEPLKIVHDLGLFGYHHNRNDQDSGPGNPSSWGSDRMLPELRIPPQLKSLRTIYFLQRARRKSHVTMSDDYFSSATSSSSDAQEDLSPQLGCTCPSKTDNAFSAA
ncbi:Heterokaryon incompatibility protein 6, OR allele [Colletotrichum fructicola]|nr:Heterokaryon incompatibility protein 6, OR allele [Colletotrichum fructicola]